MAQKRLEKFLGTYFDQDSVLKISRWGEILSWVVVAVYTLDFLLALFAFFLQYLRGYMVGMGPTDFATNILYIFERPFRGMVYFIALQGVSKTLLILLDMEVNTRRSADK